ncbi:hypothetical protein Dda_7146 [Drechslerella dactyloides]|uniref:Pentatricopeptide repeat-containing protein-mitochondrial domain-containing protein n=1 Tax=Drechslerella dactyloides TaxID=74499 RepID=A0AAD6ITR7_DREDA|nr:hypothetical protein Dda_7146 [Drechslerella dactyloides]
MQKVRCSKERKKEKKKRRRRRGGGTATLTRGSVSSFPPAGLSCFPASAFCGVAKKRWPGTATAATVTRKAYTTITITITDTASTLAPCALLPPIGIRLPLKYAADLECTPERMLMLRPAAGIAHQADSVCPRRLALLSRSRTRAAACSSRRSNSSYTSKPFNDPPNPSTPASWRSLQPGRTNNVNVSEALPFVNERNQSRETRIRPETQDPRRHRQISSLRNDGTSFKPQSFMPQGSYGSNPQARPTRLGASPPASGPYPGTLQWTPQSSAQTVQKMLPPEDDHRDAVNGDIPETSPRNPAYSKLIRKMQDLANNGTPSEVFIHARSMAHKGYAPTLEAYSCLIQACANPKVGCSMQQVAMGLLQELKDEGFVPTSVIYHNLLRIFARSPDYLTMEAVLKEMQSERWILPDTEGAQHILLHYLATGQLERAIEMFWERRGKGDKVMYNTYMDIIKALGRVNEVEEAMRVMSEFQKEWGTIGGAGLQPMAWYELLNIAASNYHYDGVMYIWRKVVQGPSGNPASARNTLNPDDGLCLKVLNTAGRHGAPKLALEVIRIMHNRNAAISEHHFAALIAAYAKAGDIPSAFRTLTVMRQQGVNPTTTTANAIVDALASNGQLDDVDSAYAALKDFATSPSDMEVVDVTAFNAVIAACVRLKDLERALGVFSECATLNISPTTETFNILFAGCVECSVSPEGEAAPPNKELAMFLAGEMKEIGLRPDALTYEELLKVHLYQEDEYDEAFTYLEEMKEIVPEGKVRPMVYEWIARRLEEKGDERLQMVVEEMLAMGYQGAAAPWAELMKTVAPGLVYKD